MISPNTRPAPIVCVLAVMVLSASGPRPAQTGENYSRAEADRVLKAIDRMEAESATGPGAADRSLELTENELNSYIAYRIESEKEEILQELRLKIFGQNSLEGRAVIDLSGRKIPPFLKPRMILYFSADLFVQDAKARLEFKELFIEEQKIQPFMLDVIINLAARFSGGEPLRLREGVDLPFGIKNIKTGKGSAVFYY